jgi:hypothetical protein
VYNHTFFVQHCHEIGMGKATLRVFGVVASEQYRQFQDLIRLTIQTNSVSIFQWLIATSEACGVAPPGNVGDLRGSEGHDFGLRIIPIATQEMVETAPGSSHDEYPAALCAVRHRVRLLQQWTVITMP